MGSAAGKDPGGLTQSFETVLAERPEATHPRHRRRAHRARRNNRGAILRRSDCTSSAGCGARARRHDGDGVDRLGPRTLRDARCAERDANDNSFFGRRRLRSPNTWTLPGDIKGWSTRRLHRSRRERHKTLPSSARRIEPKLIEGVEGALIPFFSFDSHWLGFYAGGELKKVSVTGGAPVSISEVDPLVRGASWGPQGIMVLSSSNRRLYRIPAEGGVPELLTVPDRSRREKHHRYPEVLPGGDAVLFTLANADIATYDEASIAVLSLATRESVSCSRRHRRALQPDRTLDIRPRRLSPCGALRFGNARSDRCARSGHRWHRNVLDARIGGVRHLRQRLAFVCIRERKRRGANRRVGGPRGPIRAVDRNLRSLLWFGCPRTGVRSRQSWTEPISACGRTTLHAVPSRRSNRVSAPRTQPGRPTAAGWCLPPLGMATPLSIGQIPMVATKRNVYLTPQAHSTSRSGRLHGQRTEPPSRFGEIAPKPAGTSECSNWRVIESLPANTIPRG